MIVSLGLKLLPTCMKKKKHKLTARVVNKPLIWQMVETTRG